MFPLEGRRAEVSTTGSLGADVSMECKSFHGSADVSTGGQMFPQEGGCFHRRVNVSTGGWMFPLKGQRADVFTTGSYHWSVDVSMEWISFHGSADVSTRGQMFPQEC
jgi:hypothetical protein